MGAAWKKRAAGAQSADERGARRALCPSVTTPGRGAGHARCAATLLARGLCGSGAAARGCSFAGAAEELGSNAALAPTASTKMMGSRDRAVLKGERIVGFAACLF